MLIKVKNSSERRVLNFGTSRYSDLQSLNKVNNFKVTVVPMTEKDVESLKNQNIDFNDLDIKKILSSNDKKK